MFRPYSLTINDFPDPAGPVYVNVQALRGRSFLGFFNLPGAPRLSGSAPWQVTQPMIGLEFADRCFVTLQRSYNSSEHTLFTTVVTDLAAATISGVQSLPIAHAPTSVSFADPRPRIVWTLDDTGVADAGVAVAVFGTVGVGNGRGYYDFFFRPASCVSCSRQFPPIPAGLPAPSAGDTVQTSVRYLRGSWINGYESASSAYLLGPPLFGTMDVSIATDASIPFLPP